MIMLIFSVLLIAELIEHNLIFFYGLYLLYLNTSETKIS